MKILICRTNRATEEVLQMQRDTFSPLVDAEVVVTALSKGPDFTVSEYDEGLIAPEMFKVAKEAEDQGYDAFIVGSCCDANARPIKELTSKMAIVEPGGAAMHVAAFLVDKFSVLTIKEPNMRAMIDKSAHRLGIASKLASIHLVQPAADVAIRTDDEMRSRVSQEMAEAAKKACDDHGAQAVVMYSLAYQRLGIVDRVRKILAQDGYEDMLVIDPAAVSLNFARMLVSCGLSQGKLSFPRPPEVRRVL